MSLEVCFEHRVLDYLLEQRRVPYSGDSICQFGKALDIELDLLLPNLGRNGVLRLLETICLEVLDQHPKLKGLFFVAFHF